MRLKVLDVFSGCGGLTSGFVQSGHFTPVGAVEKDSDAAASYALNFGEHIAVTDVHDWPQNGVPAVHVVVGGPPCQGFSPLGRRLVDDPRNGLWREYLRVIRRTSPAFFVMENVPQFLTSREFTQLERETRRGGMLWGWALESFILNAADYSVPQLRRRAFVLGRRQEMDPIGAPAQTEDHIPLGHHKALGSIPSEPASEDLPTRSVTVNGAVHRGPYSGQDLHFTRPPTDLAASRYRAVPLGGDRRDLPDALQMDCWRRHTRGATDVLGRLSWDKPSVTIRTEFFKPEKGRFLHPTAHRPITHFEAARIQGFPDTFRWVGGPTSIARQIGNAVPPPLAKALATHIARYIKA
ncbi:DNA cytosine methyltransferase [Ornithinimicrobium panacihumi]|uniref:DNA cytosine methyltransferase n=1 Tax=Ornithinimicrobium panacihumi TaxID=2008449 RepID=UPI003F8C84AA